MRGRSLGYAMLAGALLTGCASRSPARPQPFPEPASGRPTAVSPSGVPVSMLVSTALQFVGTPYLNGGATPAGFDCSGFVHYVFGTHGVSVPRTVTDLFRSGRSISPRAIRPGDLLFFTTIAPGASHVAIALDGDRFVHAPSGRGRVRVERLTTYWSTRFVGARRIAE